MIDTIDISKHEAKVDDAIAFFAESPVEETHALVSRLALEGGSSNQFTAGTGSMKFIFNDQTLSDDPSVVKKVDDAKYYLKGMMSLVTAKLFSNSKNDLAAAFDVPPESVKEIASHLPLLSSFVAATYSNKVVETTTKFSTDFLTLVLDVAAENYPGAVAKATSWLQSAGKEIEATARVDRSTYNVTVFSGIINVTKAGGIIDIEPSFQIAGARLAITDVKASLFNCIQNNTFSLFFDAPYFRATFNYDILEKNGTVRDKMNNLITQGSVDQINNSQNYFSI